MTSKHDSGFTNSAEHGCPHAWCGKESDGMHLRRQTLGQDMWSWDLPSQGRVSLPSTASTSRALAAHKEPPHLEGHYCYALISNAEAITPREREAQSHQKCSPWEQDDQNAGHYHRYVSFF